MKCLSGLLRLQYAYSGAVECEDYGVSGDPEGKGELSL